MSSTIVNEHGQGNVWLKPEEEERVIDTFEGVVENKEFIQYKKKVNEYIDNIFSIIRLSKKDSINPLNLEEELIYSNKEIDGLVTEYSCIVLQMIQDKHYLANTFDVVGLMGNISNTIIIQLFNSILVELSKSKESKFENITIRERENNGTTRKCYRTLVSIGGKGHEKTSSYGSDRTGTQEEALKLAFERRSELYHKKHKADAYEKLLEDGIIDSNGKVCNLNIYQGKGKDISFRCDTFKNGRGSYKIGCQDLVNLFSRHNSDFLDCLEYSINQFFINRTPLEREILFEKSKDFYYEKYHQLGGKECIKIKSKKSKQSA